MMDNIFIGGVTMADGKGYCRKCMKVFEYHYNGSAGLRVGEGNCPDCGSGENHGEVVREDDVEDEIGFKRSLVNGGIITADGQIRNIRHEISELNYIRRQFDKYDEEKRKELK